MNLQTSLDHTRQHGPDRSTDGLIPRAEPADSHPLSPDQEPLWFLDRLRGGNPADHLLRAWRIEGPLDVAALEQAFRAIVERHEILRTSFHDGPEGALARVRPEAEFRIERIDLTSVRPERQAVDAAAVAAEKATERFDLDRGQAFRVALIELGDQQSILLIAMHHLVGDGESFAVVTRELKALYAARIGGPSAGLPPLVRQYVDFARFRRLEVEAADQDAESAHWTRRLEGCPQVVELPLDRPRPPVQSAFGARTFLALTPDQTERLRELGQTCGATLFMTVLALVFVLLKRHTGQPRIAVGTPVSLRDRPELEDLVGMFLAMTVVDVDMADEPTFADLLRRVRTSALEAFAHRQLPFQGLARAVQRGRDLSRNPVFQVMVQLSELEELELPGTVATPFDFDPGTAQFDLSVHLFEVRGGLTGFIEYDADLFEARTMEGLKARLLTLLDPTELDPGRPVSSLRIMTAEEEERVLRTRNRTATEYPREATLPSLFEEQARRTPDRPAVRSGSSELSYGELNARANRLARHLRDQGLGPGTFAGICMRRTADMVVTVLAVLKAGGAYVPLDPAFPRERLDLVIEDSGAPIVVTDLGPAAPFERAGRRVVDLDRAGVFDGLDASDLGVAMSSRDLAYLIYTSGSTGRPKGVQIEHRSVVNFLHAMRREPGLGAEDRLLAVTTLSFDISVLELFLPLVTGALLIVADQETASDGELLKGLLHSSGATVLQATPSTWRMLLDSGWRDRTGLKKLAGGEAMPGTLADALTAMPGSLWNMYGPTETTIWSAVRRLRGSEEVRIGGPIANTRFYVVDSNLAPVPEGVPGELLIGGDGVARGYWKRPELTAERFIEDPFERDGGSRLYRTGDLVRLRDDGSLSFLGRLDRQVKVRGFRIELGDIEQTVLTTGLAKDVLVVTRDDPDGGAVLVAYLIEHADRPLSVDALRAELRAKLPHYMVPSAFVTLEAWPLTPNGKVDHKRLPAPERRRSTAMGLETAANQAERTVLEVWQKLLKVDEVGVNDNFFDLGGHSLLLAQMRAELARHFSRRLTLPDLFRLPTVRLIAAELAAEESGPDFTEQTTRASKQRQALGRFRRQQRGRA